MNSSRNASQVYKSWEFNFANISYNSEKINLERNPECNVDYIDFASLSKFCRDWMSEIFSVLLERTQKKKNFELLIGSKL